jgi:hypothetical protein
MGARADVLVLVACNVAPAAYAASTAALTYPYYTFSDVASAPGAWSMWLGMVAMLAWFGARGRPCAIAVLAVPAFPLFVLPTPIVLRRCVDARGAAHLAHAACWAVSTLTYADARAVGAFVLLFGGAYFGGQVLGLAPLVLFGCIVEWSMIQLVPLWYAARGAL